MKIKEVLKPFVEETKEFIKSLFHKLKYAMENLRERKINNMLIINE